MTGWHWFSVAAAAFWDSQLLGVLIGAWVARWGQRRQWVSDNKANEYRELLTTLSRSAHCLLKGKPGDGLIALSPDDQREGYQADVEARRVIDGRIFIATRIE